MRIVYIVKIWLAIKIKWLRPYLLDKEDQIKLKLLEFRFLMSMLGFDVSDMSDDDIKQGVLRLAKEVSESGLSASETYDTLDRLASIMRKQ